MALQLNPSLVFNIIEYRVAHQIKDLMGQENGMEKLAKHPKWVKLWKELTDG